VEAAPVATFLEAAVVRERLCLHYWSKCNGEPHARLQIKKLTSC